MIDEIVDPRTIGSPCGSINQAYVYKGLEVMEDFIICEGRCVAREQKREVRGLLQQDRRQFLDRLQVDDFYWRLQLTRPTETASVAAPARRWVGRELREGQQSIYGSCC